MDSIVNTKYGWAVESADMPRRTDLLWLKLPEKHVYMWEDEGWLRISPPQRVPLDRKDLPHG